MRTTLQAKLLPTLEYFVEEWLDLPDLLGRERYVDHSVSSIRDLLKTVSTVAAEKFETANRVVDSCEPTFDGESVNLPPETHAAWQAFVALGVLPASHDQGDGGWQLPRTVDFAMKVILGASSVGAIPAMLTDANASLILAHGSSAQRKVFAHRELSGRWAGTMCMSESQAGSSLSEISTRAMPDGDDFEDDPLGPRYRVTGNKMWISGGDHDLTENIVHLVLAKVPDAEGAHVASSSDLSLFIVPKHVVGADGRMLERNDVALVSLNHKLGFRGIPNAALAFGGGSFLPQGRRGAVGYRVGCEGDGLRQMFHMMNAARIEVGLAAASLGFAGFAYSLKYAKEREQGRAAQSSSAKRQTKPTAIIEHADVKRMLLAQKAYAEGGLALGLYAARLLDEQATGPADDARAASLLLDILTPVVKSWPSQWCLEANSMAIQVLGGAGYTRDHPVEQYWRDNRLNMIHEGTHGIQARDLLGRKVRQDGGAALAAFDDVLAATAMHACEGRFAPRADALLTTWAKVLLASERVWGTDDPWDALPNASAFLEAFGHVVVAWVWLDIALVADGSDHSEAPGKVAAMEYFYRYELPRVAAWLQVVDPGENYVRDLASSAL